MTIFGTRPEAIKMAPLVLELEKHTDEIESIVNWNNPMLLADRLSLAAGCMYSIVHWNRNTHTDMDSLRQSE